MSDKKRHTRRGKGKGKGNAATTDAQRLLLDAITSYQCFRDATLAEAATRNADGVTTPSAKDIETRRKFFDGAATAGELDAIGGAAFLYQLVCECAKRIETDGLAMKFAHEHLQSEITRLVAEVDKYRRIAIEQKALADRVCEENNAHDDTPYIPKGCDPLIMREQLKAAIEWITCERDAGHTPTVADVMRHFKKQIDTEYPYGGYHPNSFDKKIYNLNLCPKRKYTRKRTSASEGANASKGENEDTKKTDIPT